MIASQRPNCVLGHIEFIDYIDYISFSNFTREYKDVYTPITDTWCYVTISGSAIY